MVADGNNSNNGVAVRYCDTCKLRPGITKESAEANGLSWQMYSAHPSKRSVCWECKKVKMTIRPVMTKVQAQARFHKLRHDKSIFQQLKRDGKCYEYKPKNISKNLRRRNLYFWRADLEEEAAKRGWVPAERPPCSCCGGKAITELEAYSVDGGFEWEKYFRHPNQLKTCWDCLEQKNSAITEAHAKASSADLQRNESVFEILRKENRCFSYKNDTYYFMQDLEREDFRTGLNLMKMRSCDDKNEQAVNQYSSLTTSNNNMITTRSRSNVSINENGITITKIETTNIPKGELLPNENMPKRHRRGRPTKLFQKKFQKRNGAGRPKGSKNKIVRDVSGVNLNILI